MVDKVFNSFYFPALVRIGTLDKIIQSRIILAVFRVKVNVMFDQILNHFQINALGGIMQKRRIVFVCYIDVRPMICEQFKQFLFSLSNINYNRESLNAIYIDVCAAFNEPLNKIPLISSDHTSQDRHSLLVFRIDVYALLNEPQSQIQIAASGGEMQCGFMIWKYAIDVNALFHQPLYQLQIA